MPRVTSAHREARREEIITAAIRTFTEKGISRTSMADIIAAAGLSAGAIYGHFEGKRDLLAAAARHLLSRRRDEIDGAIGHGAPPSPGEAVEILLRGMLRDGVQPGALVQVWAEAATDPQLLAAMREAFEILRGALERSLRAWFAAHPDQAPDGVDATVQRLTPVLISLGQGFLVQSTLLDSFDQDTYFETVRTLLPH